MTLRKTSAWPLAQVYALLIVYASLYPFSGWRDQGISPWAFLSSPWPRYWTGFDLTANTAGYAPLGFLLALAVLRRGEMPDAMRNWAAIGYATLGGTSLAFCMESLQTYLPARVPSNLDWGLNALGTLLGAALAGALCVTAKRLANPGRRPGFFLPARAGCGRQPFRTLGPCSGSKRSTSCSSPAGSRACSTCPAST